MSRRRLPSHLELHIDAIDAEGFGVAQYGARQARVKGALAGELHTARVVGRRKGKVLTVSEGSPQQEAPQRQPAPCTVYPRCGGCNLQHLEYAAQLAHKQQRLLDELESNAVAYTQLRAAVSGPQFNYRRKARLGVRQLGDNVLVGFRESFGGRIVKMSTCLALAPPFDSLLAPLARLIESLSIVDRVPQIETAVGDSGAALVLRHLAPFTTTDVRRLVAFEERYGVRVLTQSGGYDTVAPLTADPVKLQYALVDYGVNFEFEPTDFVQVNATINRALVRTALAGLGVAPGERVADLFCGIGNFALPLARLGASVLGLEAAAESIDRARANAHRNGLANVTEFAVADLYTEGTELPLEGVTAMLLDPPRSGAGPNLANWLNSEVQRIAYVSCNPVTFAADAAVLRDSGFVLQDVGVFDMFPHTPHVETLGQFVRTAGVHRG